MECPHCKTSFPPGVLRCPNCGGEITPNIQSQNTGLWMSITSMILGIINLLAVLGVDSADDDVMGLIFLFTVVTLILGIVAIAQKNAGKGMAIAGVVLAGITLFLL